MRGWTITQILRTAALVLFGLFACFVVYGITDPDVSRAGGRQWQARNNVKQILFALQNYESSGRGFPPAYSSGKDGAQLLSWRVLILPYVEEQELYKQFHLDEPWDSPHNRSLITKMPSVFRSARRRQGTAPASAGTTPYLGVRGQNSVLNPDTPVALSTFQSRASHTVLLVEVDEAHEVIWTRPDDFSVDDPQALEKLGVFHERFLMGFADFSVQFPDPSLTLAELQNLADRWQARPRSITRDEAEYIESFSRRPD